MLPHRRRPHRRGPARRRTRRWRWRRLRDLVQPRAPAPGRPYRPLPARGGRHPARRALATLAALALPPMVSSAAEPPRPAEARGAVAAAAPDRPATHHQPVGDAWYAPPVDAPVADPFRPPPGPYDPGNRGLEYDTDPGDPVGASGPGTVVFAGAVGGGLHVTVRHADGLRTSYSFLADISVVVGQQVGRGERLGVAGERLHLGARAGDAYLDPADLFASGPVAVELVPFEVPPGSTPDAEARALAALTLGRGPSLPDLRSTASWLRARAGDAAGAARDLISSAPGPAVGARGLALAADLVDRVLLPGPCSDDPPPVRPAAGRRVALTVAGLGSTSGPAGIDELRADQLGYDDGDVVRFSYAGGRVPGPVPSGHAGAGIAANPYSSADTQQDVHAAARRLADLVVEVAGANGGATIDLYAHSLGGLVARLALVELERRGFDLGRLGVVVTVASPHGGADLATTVAQLADRPVAGTVLDGVAGGLSLGLDPDAPVVGQLAEGSDVVDELAAAGVPQGVQLLTVAARGDLVVPAPRAEVAGATNVTVPVAGLSAHGDVVSSDATTDAVARALAGRPPACEPWHDALADVLGGHAAVAAEDALGLALGAPG